MANKTRAGFTCLTYMGGPNGLLLDLDRFRCFLAYSASTLNQINFGYVCIALLLVIVMISLFGGIKENYRWFILNQAFWDLVISYSYICDNWIVYMFTGVYTPKCFYHVSIYYIKDFFQYTIDSNSYSALLLFSFTRFLALYYPNAYSRLTTKARIFALIFVFNFFIIFTNIHTVFWHFASQRKAFLKSACLQQFGNATADCAAAGDNDFLMKFYLTLFRVFSCIIFSKPLICLLLSLASAVAIVARIARHFKFQIKHRRQDLKGSIRICVVIVIQTLINLFVFILECFKNIPLFLGNTFNLQINTSSEWQCDDCINFTLPPWLNVNYGLPSPPILQAIVQGRIFIEAMVILFIMTGYRESIMLSIKTPRRYFKKRSGVDVSGTNISTSGISTSGVSGSERLTRIS